MLRGLVTACHPLPSVAVTAFATGYAASAGLGGGRLLLLAAAVLSGQLVIGWVNDWVDVPLDTAADRRDKPIPAGLVSRAAVGTGVVAAMAAGAVLSFALGAVPGALHLLVIGSGLAYDLALKPRLVSPLPYLVAFGALPAVATTAMPGAPWPAPGVMLGAGLLGVAAHFANTVGDTEADTATGVRGLPQRIGPSAALVVAAAVVAVAALVLLGTVPDRSVPASALLVAGAALAVAVLPVRARLGAGRAAFRLALLAVALVVAGFLTGS